MTQHQHARAEDTSANGHWEITAYQHSGKISFVGKKTDWDGHRVREIDDPTSEYGQYYRDGVEICLSPNEARGGYGEFLGDWYYALNDGHKDVGPFITKEAAIADARKIIEAYRDGHSGRVRSITEIS